MFILFDSKQCVWQYNRTNSETPIKGNLIMLVQVAPPAPRKAINSEFRGLFQFNDSSDSQVEDAEYVFDANENITIQVCDDGMFLVNEWSDEDESQTFRKAFNNIEDAMHYAVRTVAWKNR